MINGDNNFNLIFDNKEIIDHKSILQHINIPKLYENLEKLCEINLNAKDLWNFGTTRTMTDLQVTMD